MIFACQGQQCVCLKHDSEFVLSQKWNLPIICIALCNYVSEKNHSRILNLE